MFSCLGCGGGSSTQPLQVGQVATLSGPNREAGEQAMLGLNLALTEKDVATVQGRPLLVRHTDARGQLDNFEGEAVRLAAVNRVAAIYGGNTVEETRRLARAPVAILSPCGLRPLNDNDWVFALGLASRTRGQVWAKFLAEELKATEAALIYEDNDDEMRTIAEALVFHYSTGKLERRPISKDASTADLEQQLKGLRAKVVVVAVGPKAVLWFAQNLGDRTMVIAGSLVGLDRLERAGTYALTSFVADVAMPRTLEFAQAFTKAHGKAPDEQAALAYDGLRLFAHALAKTTPLTLEQLLKEVRGLKDFPGLTGALGFSPDQVLRRPAFVVRSQGQEWKLVKQYDREEEKATP
jgi:branched-chain amino acid transport system substrate-binding protein